MSKVIAVDLAKLRDSGIASKDSSRMRSRDLATHTVLRGVSQSTNVKLERMPGCKILRVLSTPARASKKIVRRQLVRSSSSNSPTMAGKSLSAQS
jgi:hypothetical protein